GAPAAPDAYDGPMGTWITARRVLAPAVVSAVVFAFSAPARACLADAACPALSKCDTSTGTCRAGLDMPAPGSAAEARAVGALVLGGFGTVFSVFGLLWAAKALDVVYKDPVCGLACWNNVQASLYVGGGILAAMGGGAVALQATVSEPCPFKSTCQV